MSNPHEYSVGWICALSTEYVAARAFLEEIHQAPEYISPNDNNDYTLGKIGKHSVVIAVLPNGEYGISSATSVARDMLHSFPNVRIGLMVGIGGGAPSPKHDIRLGDVIVGVPGNGKGGVLQYDFGKAIQGQEFVEAGFLNQPPPVLRAAVSGLMAQYESEGHQIEEAVNKALGKKPRLRKKYKRPETATDRLYRAHVVHPVDDQSGCPTTCGDNLQSVIQRLERIEDDDNPTIHYGLIASANTLMKNALMRDALIEKHDILCFEMEAAGLVNHFPCLVIRGICDYADSHKNKEWQGYAAMTAAAYASDLLHRIIPSRVEDETKIGDILSGLHHVAEEHRDVAKEQLQAQKDLAKRMLSDKEEECHQMFRLTTSSRDATYEWYKDRVEDRVEDTCLWFLNHENFRDWLKQDSGPLLVTADPGCGKSVLAKYLIDHGLPRSTTICYFFFKDQDQNTVRQALCAVLHQLFSQKPCLIEHALSQFRENGQGLINSTESLWRILRNATAENQAETIVIVFDALDECAEPEFTDLIQNIKSQFRNKQSSQLKYLLTCRPYEQIVSEFRDLLDDFPKIRIPGEEESETISQEVNRVIAYRVNQLSKKKGLTSQIMNHLEKSLQETDHRTYLWVYLVFDYLEKENFKKTPKGVDSTIATLPKSINEAYERILDKSKEHPMVRRALCIILAASRPLTLLEMNVAVNIDINLPSIYDLDLEDEEDFKVRLRSWCGLFISVHHGKVYFLHQTAREFLLADLSIPTTIAPELRWHQSITIKDADAVLAELCVIYLDFFNSNVGITSEYDEFYKLDDCHILLDYSAKYWSSHFRDADFNDGASIIPLVMRICNADSKSYSWWFNIYWDFADGDVIPLMSQLMLASYCGHLTIVKLLLEKGAEIDWRDEEERTSLLWAATNSYGDIVSLLLENGADIEAKDDHGKTALSRAADKGNKSIIKLLLKNGAYIEAKDNEDRTPLWWASIQHEDTVRWASIQHEDTVKLLLENGAKIEAKDGMYSKTPLGYAAENGQAGIVKLLLENGAEIDPRDDDSRTPLFWAAEGGNRDMTKLLIENGADVEARDRDGMTPLSCAASRSEHIVKLLIDNGADVESKDDNGQTPLRRAADCQHYSIVKLLLENGAEIDSKDKEGWTSLWWAAICRHQNIVKLLVENGANIEVKDPNGQTLLEWATKNGNKAILKLLQQKS